MAKIARYPYIAVRCPYTHEALMIREGEKKWIWRGREYDSLDDVVEARAKKFNKTVDYGQ